MPAPIHRSLPAAATLLAAITLVVALTGCHSIHPAKPPSGAGLISVEKIWNASPHQAFTDLIRHHDAWWCVFREGSAHVPGTNGVIRILSRTDDGAWATAAVVRERGVDLRDPKLSVMPDGRLMLLMGGSLYTGDEVPTARKFLNARTRVSFSANGHSWSEPQPVSIPDQWLWRVTWHDGVGWGFAYSKDPQRADWHLTLWRTTNGLAYDRIADPVLPTNCWPNETTLRFLADGSLVALVRNERPPGHNLIGTSRPPFTSWDWRDAGGTAQGPDFTVLPNERLIYGGRMSKDGPRTVIGSFTPAGPLVPLLTLPSGGDTSYPGLVWHHGELWVSYYSSHEGRAAIYVARIRLRP